jgi:hypothetical protein
VRGRNEGPFVGEKDLFEVQDRTPCRRGEGDLREPEAQAAAGMTLETGKSKMETGKSKIALSDVAPAKAGVHFRVSILGSEVINGSYFRD